jgi:hypothetical protein
MSQPYDPNNPLAPPPAWGAPPQGGGYPPPPQSSFQPPSLTGGNTRLPADLGISGLGLIMQLAGTVFTGLSGVMGLMILITMVRAGGMRGGGPGGSIIFWLLAMAATGVMRSVAHRNAGTRLLYDGPGTPLSGIKRYLTMASIQTGVWLGFFASEAHAPGSMLLALLIMLGAWPATLAILFFATDKFKQLDHGIPVSEDKGFEGGSIIMLILGLTGLGYALVMLYGVMQMPSQALSQLPGIIMILIAIMLVIRSVLHVIAGWRGVSELHMDRAVEAVSRYANFGVMTAFVAAGGMLLMIMSVGGGGAFDVTIIMYIALFLMLLLAWPLIVRKFFSERQFADILSGATETSHRRAPDLGLTSLGWLLLAFGVMAMSMSLPSAALMPEGGLGGGMRGNPLGMMFGMLQSGGLRSPWWPVGAAALQIWAGIELIRMTDSHKLVASIYGVVGTAVAIYINLPMFDLLKHGGGGLGGMLGGGDGPMGPMLFGGVAIALIIPVGTLILVNRKPR